MDLFTYISYKFNPKIIFEAGCADGTHTEMLANMFQMATIYAFEPVKEYYDIAKERTKNLKNVKIYNLALGERNEDHEIYISKNSEGNLWCSNSLLKPKEHLISNPHISFPEIRTTKVINLDTFCDENNIDRIDFFWLDMQGYEMKTLKASPKILDNIKSLYTETNIIETYEGTELYGEYKDWLIKKGFKVMLESFSPTGDQGDSFFSRD
jgi:FkbM family methyltransferase